MKILDGGGTWQVAQGTALYSGITRRKGEAGVFYWAAGQDLNAIDDLVSDNVRFRITVIHQIKRRANTPLN